MKKLNFKKISVVALNDAQIGMIRGGHVDEAGADVAEEAADAIAGTRKVSCCSCCKGTKCKTKKSSYSDEVLGE